MEFTDAALVVAAALFDLASSMYYLALAVGVLNVSVLVGYLVALKKARV